MTSTRYEPSDALLARHGDLDATPGLVDLAVNVRPGTPPAWLRDRLAQVDLSRYPDATAAREAVAARHGRPVEQVLLTSGAAEAFVLIARAFTPRQVTVVHPQFTEPEIAMRNAGHHIERLVLPPPFGLDPAEVPDTAEIVCLGNPTNPTSVLHPAATLRALVRPGRLLVVDEAFADTVVGEPESLAAPHADEQIAGLVVVRSLTKTWGLAGLRAGYVLAEPHTISALAALQPHWPVSALALEATAACSAPAAVVEAARWATGLARVRAHLVKQLASLDGVDVVPAQAASFVLIHVETPGAVATLRERGFAVRPGDTFPGLGPQWMRIAVRDEATSIKFVNTLKEIL